jgi:nucleotide-binding universal stress UspA family protein
MAKLTLFQTILCPVDFSNNSRQALAYAALLAWRTTGRLVVIFAEDPLLAAAAGATYGEETLIEKDRKHLRRFVAQTIAPFGIPARSVTSDVVIGRPDQQIALAAERFACDLIVMGAHGWTGANKVMFGSTTHRILRRSPLPVLAIQPAGGRMRAPAKNWPGERAIAPINFGTHARADVLAAAVVARELGTELHLVHVVEPIAELPWIELDAERRNRQRRRSAMVRLTRLRDDLAWAVADCRIEQGAPASEIARLAANSRAGLVIMTRRRGQGLFGPRQGSISYQVLCEAKTPILALPSNAKWMRGIMSRIPGQTAA